MCGTFWEGGVGRLLVHKHTPASRMGREEPRTRAGCPEGTQWAVGVWQWESLLQAGSEEDGEGSVLVGTPELRCKKEKRTGGHLSAG